MFPRIAPVLSLSPLWFTAILTAFAKSFGSFNAQYVEIAIASSPTQPSPSFFMASDGGTSDFASF